MHYNNNNNLKVNWLTRYHRFVWLELSVLTSHSVLELREAGASPPEQGGRPPGRRPVLAKRLPRGAAVGARRVPRGCTPRAGQLSPGLPARPDPPPRRRPQPLPRRSGEQGRAGRAGLSTPGAAAALLKKPERAAPLSFYVRARGEAPTPGATAAALGRPALPALLCGAAPAPLRLSTSPANPGPPGG